MNRPNEKVRKAARISDVSLWRIAAYIGVSEPTLSRWLRMPLTADKESQIMKAICELSQEVS